MMTNRDDLTPSNKFICWAIGSSGMDFEKESS